MPPMPALLPVRILPELDSVSSTAPSVSPSAEAIEIEVAAKQIVKTKQRLNQLLSKHTGQPLAKIEKDTDRDFFMTSEEAKKYGLVDNILK